MTPWPAIDPDLRDLCERVLTPSQLDAFKLSLDGAGQRRIAQALGISRESARDRLHAARRRLAHAIEQENHAA